MTKHIRKQIIGMSSQKNSENPLVSVVMGSNSDLKTMQHAITILEEFNIPFEAKVVSAHRTPDRLYEFAKQADSKGIKVIIAGAGGAAHLPGMIASMTIVPVLGVPVQSKALNGQDSLLSIVQMPAGIPVGTLAIGDAGAKNAALLAISILAMHNDPIKQKLMTFRKQQTDSIKEELDYGTKTS